MNGKIFDVPNLINKASIIIDSIQKVIPIYNEIKPLFIKINEVKNKIANIDYSKFKPKILTNKEENKEIIDKQKEEKKNYVSSSPQFFL